MLVTRPDPDASDTAARLEALGIEPVIAPLLIHETLPAELPAPDSVAAITLTSANALRALQEMDAIGRYRELPVYTVGDRTADLAEALGFVMVTSASGAFADLAELLAHARIDGPIFYPHGREVSADLGRSLEPFGKRISGVPVYAMNPVMVLDEVAEAGLASGEIGAALFYSKRTAECFVRLTAGLARERRMKLGVLCMSEAVAAPLIDAHFVRVGLAEHPDEEAMMGLALSFARDQNPH
ncbi:uroporphyrinogen-III synthase [Devosia sp. ZB163]|uniref:uroporphyrinogen-III synthase n=1 Tax=Devosia sp. ZB163 TaxID=3025938 RepID=UPI002361AF79|nr:uroporphyrinogen-III synthase [Devosia sp. ZB163]MDC9822222.1 uroporphyrinogen-III synthase [Devosia sp. ZB163]